MMVLKSKVDFQEIHLRSLFIETKKHMENTFRNSEVVKTFKESTLNS